MRNEIVPGAEWVVNGEGTATEKIDGTCCLVKDGKLFKRYDAKKGKKPPEGFIPAQDPDPVTGHWPGWIAVGDGPEDRWHREGLAESRGQAQDGTHELIGPKVQGNPYQLDTHFLFRHGATVLKDVPRDFDGLKAWFQENRVEGVVWWRDLSDQDCDKVKIKRRDFGLPWP